MGSVRKDPFSSTDKRQENIIQKKKQAKITGQYKEQKYYATNLSRSFQLNHLSLDRQTRTYRFIDHYEECLQR